MVARPKGLEREGSCSAKVNILLRNHLEQEAAVIADRAASAGCLGSSRRAQRQWNTTVSRSRHSSDGTGEAR
jgi:hypothetical protein